MSNFEVIPAIDLRGGNCVRLYQGDYDKETVYGADPAAMAKHWQSLGAKRLHVVDLDGARSGVAVNAEAVRSIIAAVDIPVELGGGVRDIEAIQRWLDAGLDRVYLGTAAVTNPELVKEACERFPGHVAVGADARDGRIATRGWESDSGEDVISFTHRVVADGARTLTYTNVSKDGTFEGPDTAGATRLLEALNRDDVHVILAGGVGSLEHVLASAAVPRLGAVIIGRALYEGRVDLAEAIEAVRKLQDTPRR